jgi:hypothetical protein
VADATAAETVRGAGRGEARFGELVQLDGRFHEWLTQGRGAAPACTLLRSYGGAFLQLRIIPGEKVLPHRPAPSVVADNPS